MPMRGATAAAAAKGNTCNEITQLRSKIKMKRQRTARQSSA
jgi:hypothetical protein